MFWWFLACLWLSDLCLLICPVVLFADLSYWSVYISCLCVLLADLSYIICSTSFFAQYFRLQNPAYTHCAQNHPRLYFDWSPLFAEWSWLIHVEPFRAVNPFVLSVCVMVFVGLGRAESLKIRINEKSKFPAGRSEWVARDWADQENRLFGSGMVDHLCKKNMGGQYEWAGVCPVGWLWTG